MLFTPLGATISLWYAAPLVVAISLVYGATRHELMQPILWHALRAAGWIVGFMAIIYVLLSIIARFV